MLAGILATGILDDADQDRLAKELLWSDKARHTHPLGWIGSTFIEFDLDAPRRQRKIQTDPDTPVTIEQWWTPSAHHDHPLRQRARQSWDRSHPKLTHTGAWTDHDGPLPIVEGTVIRLQVNRLPAPAPRNRCGCGHSATATIAEQVNRLWRMFQRRFDLEHTFPVPQTNSRLDHTPRAGPEAVDQWTRLVIAAYNRVTPPTRRNPPDPAQDAPNRQSDSGLVYEIDDTGRGGGVVTDGMARGVRRPNRHIGRPRIRLAPHYRVLARKFIDSIPEIITRKSPRGMDTLLRTMPF